MARLFPRKKLGQNFLNSRHYAARIAEFAAVRDDVVIEIGAGKGALTGYLAAAARTVYAVEIDGRLIDQLRRSAPANTIILNQDFLEMDIGEFRNPVIIGNIPYPISTPIFEKLAFESNKFKRAVITIQKEFCDRMLAPPAGSRYGPLSLMASYFFKVVRGFEIPGRFFRPSPGVRSVVTALEPRKYVCTVQDEKDFFGLIRECFRHRRQSIGKRFGGDLTRETLGRTDFRPQELSLEQWINIYKAAMIDRLKP